MMVYNVMMYTLFADASSFRHCHIATRRSDTPIDAMVTSATKVKKSWLSLTAMQKDLTVWLHCISANDCLTVHNVQKNVRSDTTPSWVYQYRVKMCQKTRSQLWLQHLWVCHPLPPLNHKRNTPSQTLHFHTCATHCLCWTRSRWQN